MYNLIEYSGNYSNISGSLWRFKRDNNANNANANLTLDNYESFKYKETLVEKAAYAAGGNNFLKNTKIVVPLKYLSHFWR